MTTGEFFQIVNPSALECKYVLPGHAFEQLGVNRVELKTDILNERSRKAMLRLGHMITAGGRVSDTVYFSILREEWPEVKARLEGMMAR